MKLGILLTMVCCTGLTSMPANAQAPASVALAQYQFNIGARSLSDALGEFARQTELQVARFSDVDATQVHPVVGTYTAEQALALMLAGSGLTYRFVNDRTVAIVKAEIPSAKSEPAGAAEASVRPQLNNKRTDDGDKPMNHSNVFSRFAAFVGSIAAAVSTFPVHAQGTDAAGSAPTLEEIVITAQKRTERLGDIPVSASVISDDAIANMNASDISDINKLVPSVNLNGSFNGRVPMGIRGISSVSNEGTVGLSSGVAIMIDGVPVPSDSVGGNQLEDIQSIEVLKGPQATLGGRTAATGVINIVTRKPSDTLTGNVSLTATDDKEYRASGFISGPITNGIDFSVSAYGNQREFPIENIYLGRNSSQKSHGARAKLSFKPTDDLDVTLTGRYAKTTSDGFNFVYTYVTPGTTLLVGTGGPPFLSASALMPGVTPSLENQQYSSLINVGATSEDKDASLNIEWRLGSLTLGSITAFQHETQDNTQDLFAISSYFWNVLTGGAAPPFFNSQNIKENINQFSQEFKLASSTDQPFSYLVGAFYSDTKVREQQTRNLLPAYNNVDVTPETKTYDVYARTTWKFLPQTSLITGLRYNYDELSYRMYQKLYTFSFPPPVILTDQFAADSSHSSTVVGDIALQQRFGEDSMVYASYARGYSPGAYNTTQAIDSSRSGLTTAKPKLDLVSKETVDHFEIGSKNSFGNRRVTLNASIFDTIYKNFQIQNFDKSSTSINPPLILAAVGKAETRGVELDTSIAATTTTRLDLNLAYVDAKFKDYPDAPCYYGSVTVAPGTATCTQNLRNKPMPNSPKLKFTTNLEQRLPLNAIPYEIVFDANYAYRTSTQMLTDQNPRAELSAFGILNVNLGFASTTGNFSVTAFADNVFDKHYVVDVEDFWSAPWGGTNVVVAQPARDANRYFGVRINAGF